MGTTALEVVEVWIGTTALEVVLEEANDARVSWKTAPDFVAAGAEEAPGMNGSTTGRTTPPMGVSTGFLEAELVRERKSASGSGVNPGGSPVMVALANSVVEGLTIT